jgi:diguanylate cyclase (GGDEF)-like protein
VIGREQRSAREEALQLSRFDLLTGLYSRAYLVAALDQEIRRAARSGRPFSLLLIDLDGLKAANDRYGHDSGDRLLRAVAEVLHGDVRATDVAARYGGDEFVLLLPETDVTGAALVADKVRVDIARISLSHNGGVIRTSASIGLVGFPHDGRSAAELMRKADLAMYEAKRRGRDQIVRFARRPTSVPAPSDPVARTAAVPVNRPGGGLRATPGPAPWESTRS